VVTELPCPAPLWPRFSALLDALLELPEGERDSWLSRLDGEDAAIKPWLARVLRSNATASTVDFLTPPLLPEGFDHAFQPGMQIGPYRLDSPLGEGGMGVVWRASRADDGPRREVALKLPHAEMLSGPFRTRFRRERDVLAGLTHPQIAVLYDAGITLDGHPYMALELVTGAPITAWCARANPSLQRRMELIEQVLAALSYAHQRLIVHRDIKPSNVLVTDAGGVKLLDFGIAKLLRGAATEATQLTQMASRMATPGYGAPEQMAGGDITVAADLFSVGVLAFELCTGALPFHPVPLSPDAAPAPLASRRAAGRAGFARLSPGLRGDLDAIIAKALSLDPAARYSSADAFARDLRRWREGLPVSARRVGWPVLARKFVARNRAGVALAAVLALALAGGGAGIAWQGQRATREAARANAIKDFMVGMFSAGDPANGNKPSETMTAKELLDLGTDRADAAFKHDPATEIELLETLGRLYDDMSDGKRAEQVRSRQLDLARALHGPAAPDVIADTLRLVNTEVLFLNESKANALLESIRGPVFSLYGPHSFERANWLGEHAHALRATSGGRDQAIAESLATVAILEKYYPTHPYYADALLDLSGYQYDAEQYEASLASLQRARDVELGRHDFGEMDELMYRADRGTRLERMGRLAEAEQMYTEEAARAERITGHNNTFYVHARNALANLVSLRGESTRADSIFADTLSVADGNAASTGAATSLRRAYGAALAREGRLAEAVPMLERALAETKLHPRDEANLRRTKLWLGDAYAQLGRAIDARPLLQEARDEWMRYGVPNGSQALAARERWARFLADQGETAPAQAEFTAVVQLAKNAPSAPAAMAHAGLARLALGRGALAEADSESIAAQRVLDATTLEYDVRLRLEIWLTRAQVLRAQSDQTGARALAAKALAAAQLWDMPQSPMLQRLKDFLAPA
jgi:serine/threonine-protein kinase